MQVRKQELDIPAYGLLLHAVHFVSSFFAFETARVGCSM